MFYIFYILIYSICVYGFCNVMVYGAGPFNVLEKFRIAIAKIHRTFGDLMSCMMCFPTTVGFALSILNILVFPTFSLTPGFVLVQSLELWPIIIFIDMFFTSGIVWLLHTLQEMMERKNIEEEIEVG